MHQADAMMGLDSQESMDQLNQSLQQELDSETFPEYQTFTQAIPDQLSLIHEPSTLLESPTQSSTSVGQQLLRI